MTLAKLLLGSWRNFLNSKLLSTFLPQSPLFIDNYLFTNTAKRLCDAEYKGALGILPAFLRFGFASTRLNTVFCCQIATNPPLRSYSGLYSAHGTWQQNITVARDCGHPSCSRYLHRSLRHIGSQSPAF